MGSPRPSWLAELERKMPWPPSWKMPVSKETRVRVELLAKIMARVLPSTRGIMRLILAASVRGMGETTTVLMVPAMSLW